MNQRVGARGALRVGAHTSIAGGLHLALERGAEAGCDVIQVFSKSNQQWAARPIADSDLASWAGARASTGVIPAMVHTSYLLNLASPERALREKSLRALAEEYRRCALLAAPYLVLHPGAHLGTGEARGIRRVAAALDRLFVRQPDNPVLLLLETTAGQGSCIGHRFEHLRDVLAALRHPERAGVCVDTCHVFAAGYDITTNARWHRAFDRFDAVLGCEHIKAVHANDSKTPLGSRVDRHAHLGRGHIGLAGFRCLVNDARFTGLPIVLETPKPTPHCDPINLAILRALAGRSRVGARAKRLAAQSLEQPPSVG